MELKDWKKGLENYLPALDTFFKKVLMKQSKVSLKEAAEIDNKQAIELLKEGDIVVKVVEERFNTELLIAFPGVWIQTLSEAVLGVENEKLNEITQDLVKEFSENLLLVVQSTFSEIGIDLAIADISILKSGQISKALVLDQFYSATLDVESKFEMKGDKNPELSFAVIMSEPEKGSVKEVMKDWDEENPFLSTDFGDIGQKKAQNVEMQSASSPENGSTNGKGIKVTEQNVEFQAFDRNKVVNPEKEVRNLDLLKDVEMSLSVELGRRTMPLGKILQIVKGSVIELEKLAGEPVEILVNGRCIAQGDVVVIDEHFGVRITNLLAGHEKMKAEL